ALWGGFGLSLTAFAIHLALVASLPTSIQVDIPMLAIAESASFTVAVIYSGILLAEVYTSAVGSLYGFAARLTETYDRPLWQMAAVSGISAYLFSLFGITVLIETLMPLAGYLGFLLLA